MSNAAKTETRTQYGIRQPDGEIVWQSPGTPRYLNVDIDGAVRSGRAFDGNAHGYVGNGRTAVKAAMRATAKDVGVPAEEFVNGHEFLTRQIITITMEPVTVPEPAADLQGRF